MAEMENIRQRFSRGEKQRNQPVFALADEHPAGMFDFDSNLSIPHRKRTACRMADCSFWRRWRISVSVFPEGKNKGIRQCAHWRMNIPLGCSILIRISPSRMEKRTACRMADCSFWRRWRDSNSRRAFDPYTISNRARSTNYATSPCLLKKTSYSLCSLVIIMHPGAKVKTKFPLFPSFHSRMPDTAQVI